MKQPQSQRPSTRHEALNYLAWPSPAGSLSLMPRRLCSLEKTCLTGFFAPQKAGLARKVLERLPSSPGMDLLCRLENSRLVALLLAPWSKDDPGPNIRKCMHSGRMAFPFSSFMRIVLPCPILALYILLSELIQHVVPWFCISPESRGLTTSLT